MRRLALVLALLLLPLHVHAAGTCTYQGGVITCPGGGVSLSTANSWTALQTFAAGLLLGSNDVLQWGDAVGGGTADTGLARASAGVLQVNTGTAGTLAALTASKLTLTTGTLTTSQPALNITQTWNAAGVTFNGLLLNVTTTASAAASSLLDLQANGTSTFRVDKGTLDSHGIHIHGTQQSHGLYFEVDNASQRNWGIFTGYEQSQDLTFRASTVAAGNPYSAGASVLRLKPGAEGIVLHTDIVAHTPNGFDLGSTTAYLKTTYVGTSYVLIGANAQRTSIKHLTELTTIAAAATTDTTIQIPANCTVLGVTVRVTTAIPTAATFDVGVAGATTRYGTGISTAATTTNASPGTTNTSVYGSAVSVRFTPNLTPADNSGRVRITIHYVDLTAATS